MCPRNRGQLVLFNNPKWEEILQKGREGEGKGEGERCLWGLGESVGVIEGVSAEQGEP